MDDAGHLIDKYRPGYAKPVGPALAYPPEDEKDLRFNRAIGSLVDDVLRIAEVAWAQMWLLAEARWYATYLRDVEGAWGYDPDLCRFPWDSPKVAPAHD